MMRPLFFWALISSCIMLASCDTPIHPTLQSAAPVVVVDAFIDNKLETQVIHLTMSQPYFDETLPPGVSGASVQIRDDDGTTFVFSEDPDNKGDYVWIPIDSAFGKQGHTYSLSIHSGADNFVATTTMGRVPPVDSITFAPGNRVTDGKNFYRAQFWAVDPVGPGDTYWIKAYKNGVLLNKPSEINLAWDASFSRGGGFDGLTFIQPIRNGINPDDTDSNNRPISPYSPGDTVTVEINSLTPATFDYLNQVIVQTNRPGGFSELFARPIGNVGTNITNTNSSGNTVVGFFNVASVSANTRVFVK